MLNEMRALIGTPTVACALPIQDFGRNRRSRWTTGSPAGVPVPLSGSKRWGSSHSKRWRCTTQGRRSTASFRRECDVGVCQARSARPPSRRNRWFQVTRPAMHASAGTEPSDSPDRRNPALHARAEGTRCPYRPGRYRIRAVDPEHFVSWAEYSRHPRPRSGSTLRHTPIQNVLSSWA